MRRNINCTQSYVLTLAPVTSATCPFRLGMSLNEKAEALNSSDRVEGMKPTKDGCKVAIKRKNPSLESTPLASKPMNTLMATTIKDSRRKIFIFI